MADSSRRASFRRIQSLFDVPTRDELHVKVLREKLELAERKNEEVAARNVYLALKVKHLMKFNDYYKCSMINNGLDNTTSL